MNEEKAISIPIKNVPQLKIILATWYSFIQEHSRNFTAGDYTSNLRTPVIYNLAKDEIEVLFTGTDEVLNKFKEHIFKKTGSTKRDLNETTKQETIQETTLEEKTKKNTEKNTEKILDENLI